VYINLILHVNAKFQEIMKPIDFPQSTKVLQKPSDMTDKECLPLPVWCDGKHCISCWKPTLIERLKVLFIGKVWIGILSGNTQPPIFVSGENVFVKPLIKARFCAFATKLKDIITNAIKSVYQGFKQPDKRKHFIVGFAISLLVGVFIPWLGVVLAFIAGAIKERWDSKGNGTPEWLDFIFTYLGGAAALPSSYFFHGAFQQLFF
jgi:hypothetical protein